MVVQASQAWPSYELILGLKETFTSCLKTVSVGK